MNYLAHFYHNNKILECPLTAAEYYWGAVFPDIARVFDRGLRIRLTDIVGRIKYSGELSFWNGLRNHIQADQAFHQAPFFYRLQKSYADYLETEGKDLTARQQRIIAHLGVELLFDHDIHTRDPEFALCFYEVLGRVSMENLTASVRSLFGETEQLGQHLRRFLNSAFLLKYHDLNFLSEVMIYKMGISRDNGSSETAKIIRKSFEVMRPYVSQHFPELTQLLRDVK